MAQGVEGRSRRLGLEKREGKIDFVEIVETPTSMASPFEIRIVLVNPHLIGTHERCVPDFDFSQISFEQGFDGPPISVGEFHPGDYFYNNLVEEMSVLDNLEYGDLGVLDGHHRLEKAKRLGLSYVPVQLIPLRHPSLIIGTWLDNYVPLTVEQVVAHFKQPDMHVLPKATKFQVRGTDGSVYRIAHIQPTLRMPIELIQ